MFLPTVQNHTRNLKQGIRQWKIFPKSIALNKVDQLAIALNDSREFFVDAQLINASFSEIGYHDYEELISGLLKSDLSLIV